MPKSNVFKVKEFLGPIIVGLVAIFLKLPFTSQGFFAFTYDQGRDFLKVAQIIYDGKIMLIGPTTGLPGVFYGPWWYYFLSPLLYLSGGNPQKVAIFFGFLGVATVIGIYLLIRYLTDNLFLSICFGIVAAMSASWMLGPTLIWNPSLAPMLMIFLIFIISKIFTSPKPIYYFMLGLVTLLIADSSAFFGSALILSLVISSLIVRGNFLRKEFILTVAGAILVLSPRILFDVRHNFLITKAIGAYLATPKIYGEQLSFIPRFIQRLDLFFGFFSWSIARGNKIIALFIIILSIIFIFILFKNKKSFLKLKGDKLLIFLSLLVVFLFIGFTLFRDRVWDHYLVGLPVILIVILAKIINTTYLLKNSKYLLNIFIVLLVIINFNKQLISPFKITWLGGGSDYRNQKMVMDYISGQNPQNYSIYAYSPAIFDYPFDYLIYWYQKRGLIQKPRDSEKLIYLIIRDDDKHTYLTRGWYGDKTKDKTTLLDRKAFPGQLILEKHLKND